MATETYYKGITETVSFTANTGHTCKICRKESLGGDIDTFADSINHCINEHGFRLLHVGQETIEDNKQTTVAVLGK